MVINPQLQKWSSDQYFVVEVYARKGIVVFPQGFVSWFGGPFMFSWARIKNQILNYNNMITFEYPEDREYFISLLAQGDSHFFEQNCLKYFDFRDPKIKRNEFNKIRQTVLKTLVQKYGLKCQLKLHPDCSKIKKFDIDHLIPLSTNELNKKIRKLKPENSKKVPTQSFGSNDINNLVIACSRCNAYKKHRIIIPKNLMP